MRVINQAKKLSALLLTFILLAGLLIPATSLFAAAKEVTVTADGINAGRGYGELVIFTSDFGATTGTNEWGYEVTVGSDNKVTKVDGNNSAIPAGGFVLSGHDVDEGKEGNKMKTFLKENVQVGDYVYYNDATLVITISDKPVVISSYYTASTTFDGVNVTRNTDLMILYDKKGTYTATNEWGYEVVCENNTVVSLGGNNNLVPNTEGSFVVSGHGKAVEWLKANVKIGMSATYDLTAKTITFVYDEKSATIGIDLRIKAIEKEYADAVAAYKNVDFKTAKAKIDEAKNIFNAAKEALNAGGEASAFDGDGQQVGSMLDEATLLLTESRTVEYRGVWVRPTQKTAKEVEDYIQSLYDGGINLVCVETLYNSTMIMPMPKGNLFVQNPIFSGFDVLKAYVDACHERNMELHVWMPIFYVGHEGGTNANLGLGKKKPEWLTVSNTGSHYAPDDPDKFLMINPANEEATAFLLETYKYILTTYDIDGFELDYIRYWTNQEGCDFGYDDVTTSAFEAKYGIKPEFNPKASYWNNWVAFRAQYVTNMVEKVRALINEVSPSVLLSAAVGPDPKFALNSLYQDYMTWLDKGYLDLLHPMSYGEGYEEAIQQQAKRCGSNVYLAVGLGSFMSEFDAMDMLRQSKIADSLGADGVAFFESASYLNKGVGAVLTSSIFKNKAITPNYNKTAAVKASLEYLVKRIDDVILPLKGVTEQEADNIKTAINAIITANDNGTLSTDSFKEAKTAIEALTDANAKKALLNDLAYATKITNISKRVSEKVATPAVSTDSSAEVASSQESATDENNWAAPVITGSIIALAAIAAFILIRKKNKK